MTSPHELLSAAGWRHAWQGLLAVLLVGVAWLAFMPDPPDSHLPQGDKLKHLLAFATLAVAAGFSVLAGARRLALAALGLLAYGGTIELVQAQLPYRSGEWLDLLADAAGIAIGLALSTGIRLRILRSD